MFLSLLFCVVLALFGLVLILPSQRNLSQSCGIQDFYVQSCNTTNTSCYNVTNKIVLYYPPQPINLTDSATNQIFCPLTCNPETSQQTIALFQRWVRDINVFSQNRIGFLILANLVFNQRQFVEIIFSLAFYYIVYLFPIQFVCIKRKNCREYGLDTGAYVLFVMAGVLSVSAWAMFNYYIRRIFW